MRLLEIESVYFEQQSSLDNVDEELTTSQREAECVSKRSFTTHAGDSNSIWPVFFEWYDSMLWIIVIGNVILGQNISPYPVPKLATENDKSTLFDRSNGLELNQNAVRQ